MASREIDSIVFPRIVLNITNITSNGTSGNNVAVDTSGFESAEYLFFSTVDFTDGDYVLNVFAGSSSNPALHTQVPTDDLTSSDALTITQFDELFRIGYIGKERFVSASIAATNVTVGARIGAFVILNTPRHPPTPPGPGFEP